MLNLLLGWSWLAAVVFVVACLWRAIKYARAPEHLRWDLYPVAHEPNKHGGSFLEEKDWWTKPRVKSHLGEIKFMVAEIFWLRGVHENHRRLWRGSLPFHWGLYLLTATSFGLLISAFGLSHPAWLTLLAVGAVGGGVLTAVGAFYILILRSNDPRLRPYTTTVDKLNLALLVVLGGLSAAVAISPPGMAQVTAAVGRMVRLQAPEVSTLLAAQMAVAALFIFYLPFTRMVHFFSKYFTYHAVRWDDRTVEPGSALEKSLRGALDFGVSWSAEHVRTGKTWAEVATRLPGEEEKSEN